MAQQASNPQREPSMDEILASIRRIIEESEPDRPGVDLSAIDKLAAEPAAVGPAANDAAPASVQPAGKAVETEAVAREGSVFTAGRTEPVVSDEAELFSESFDADTFALGPELDSAFRELDRPDLMELPKVDADPVVEPRSGSNRLDSTLSEAMAGSPALSPTAIISERTGRQVAASFGDLADVFASRRRSFDEVAEEMMRPMLQDWMDNNLPMLVERLVREEIERVARGG